MRGKSCLLENIISCAIMSQNKSIFIGCFTFFSKFGTLSITEIEKEGKIGPVCFHPRKFSEGLFRGKEVHWNIANALDHANASGDVSSRDKSSELTDIIVPENEMSRGKLYSLSSPQQKNPIRENGNEKNPLSESARQLNVSYKSDEQLNKETVKRIANYGGVVSATLRTFVSALCEFYNSR